MNKLHLLILFGLTVLQISSTNPQAPFNELIIGKWSGIRKETRNGIEKHRNGQLIKEVGIYDFQKNGVVIDLTNPPYPAKLSFTIKGDLLVIGRLAFKIEKLDKNNLVIIDFDPSTPNAPLAYRHYFKRHSPHK